MPDRGIPEYGLSDRAEIIGYEGADERWHYVDDKDWAPPVEDDFAVSTRWLISLDSDSFPPNAPEIVSWVGPIDGVSLDDILDYYAGLYEELSG